MTMTKASLVDEIQRRIGFPKSQAMETVEEIFETIKAALERGENLKISGFGSFTPKSKNARMGRNPKTGEPMEISARRVVTFRASPVLKERMNEEIKEEL